MAFLCKQLQEVLTLHELRGNFADTFAILSLCF